MKKITAPMNDIKFMYQAHNANHPQTLELEN